MSVRFGISAALGVAFTLLTVQATIAEPVEFIVLGDMPYSIADAKALEDIGRKLESSPYPFAIHYGDIKSGSSSCAKEELRANFAFIDRIFRGPSKRLVFYTPGDNDWTDCDREETHDAISELDALGTLRSLFFSPERFQQLQQHAPAWAIIQPDPEYPENIQWTYRNVQFVLLHIVGSDNGRAQILKSDPHETLNMVDKRDRANLTALAHAFSDARDQPLDAIVVVIHADPHEIKHREYLHRPCTEDERTLCNPYAVFLRQLKQHAHTFRKPVLLVHGSTHPVCIDRGLGGTPESKMWRFNGPGDGVRDAAIVTFTGSASEPFIMKRVLQPDTAVPNCNP